MLQDTLSEINHPFFLKGGGVTGQLIRSIDWSEHPLGVPDQWPDALKFSISMMLNCAVPMSVNWGMEYYHFYNDDFLPLMGMNRHPNAMGSKVEDVYSEIWHIVHPLHQRVMNGEGVAFKDRLIPLERNGMLEDSWFDFSYNPIRDSEGTIAGMLTIAAETTDKIRHTRNFAATAAELQAINEALLTSNNELETTQADLENTLNLLKISEQQVRSLVESAPFPIGVYVGKEMRIGLANQSLMDVWGKGNDVIGKLYSEILPELNNQQIFEQLDSVFTTGKPFHTRNQRVDIVVDGRLQPFFFNYSFTPLFDADGKIYGVMNTAAEVTDLNEAKQKVEQNERNLRNMILQAPVAMSILLGPQHVFAVANQMMITLLGKPEASLMNKPVFEALPDATGQGLEQAMADVYQTGETFKAIEQPVTLLRNGVEEVVYQNFVYEPYKDADGTILGLIAITIDVTEQVVARQKIEESEERYKKLTETLIASEQKLDQILSQLSTPIAVFRGNTFITESANQAMLDFWHKDKTAVLGKPIGNVLNADGIAPFIEQLKRVYNTGKPYVAEDVYVIMVDEKGNEKASYLDYIYQPLMEPDGTWSSILATAFDVTGKAESRKLMEENAQRMQLLNDEMTTANEQYHMAISTANLGTWRVDLKTNLLSVSGRARKMYGVLPKMPLKLADAIGMVLPEHKETVSNIIINAVKNSESFEIEYPIQPMDGSAVKWLRTTGKVYVDPKADRAHITGTIMDITERKLDELRKNDFISMVSHELKTPLTSLSAIVQIAQDKLQNDSDEFLNGAMAKAYSQVKRMTNLINGFLNVSRLESGKIHLDKMRFDVVKLTKEIIDDMSLTAGNQQIILESEPDILMEGDREKIGSVITNLISNGLKYSPRDSKITIHLSTYQNLLQASISDEGYGIDPNDKEKIFERYYRSSNSKSKMISGFGIGLYLSAEIISRHNGKIWVEGNADKGSTFYFQIPLQQ